jgi:predicted DCC family thiol-disulfide oxidoreductase YuxK
MMSERSNAATPETLTVLYDGDCVLCNYWISKIKRNKNAQKFQCLSLSNWKEQFDNQPIVSIKLDTTTPDSVVVIRGEKHWIESDAILLISRNLSGPIQLLTAGYIVPKLLRDLVYRFVARNRYRWFGRTDRC